MNNNEAMTLQMVKSGLVSTQRSVVREAYNQVKKILGFLWAGFGLVSMALGGGPPLLLDWGVVDTSSAMQQKLSQAVRTSSRATTVQALSAAGTAPWLVQFNGVIQEDWKAAMEAAGAKLKGYIPENAFLIEATPKQIAAIGAMADVVWVGEYLPAYKKAANVRAKLARVAAAKEADAASAYRVLLLSGDDLDAVVRKIEALTGAAVTAAGGDVIRTDLTAAQIEGISGWGEVQWIEPYTRARYWNDVAVRTNMMNVSNAWTTLGLTGAGQIIAVADTGLDSGNTGTLHQDFTNRVAGFGWSNETYSAGYSWADSDAHGTHVSGSVLGNGTMSTGRYKGVAYAANLIIQGTQADLSGIPTTGLAPLFRQAFTNGARIHSDSWGYDDHGYYNDDSRSVDQFVWSNKTMLICIAAGNSGTDSNTTDGVIDPMSVASPATAKNCLTVGAAENYRTSGGYSSAYTWGTAWPADYPSNPIAGDYISRPYSNNIQGLAAFSSRGPCNDGRIKPDIVAPGTDIISTRSRKAPGTGWGTVTGNTNYIYEGGTSMATPLTAGAAGLTRQWITTTGGVTNPSGQLLKALMLNGARNMAPGQYGPGAKQEIPTVRPNNVEGWGHVDLFNTLQPATNQFLTLYDTNSLATGQTNTFSLTVSATSTNKFILTMAYADYWGTAGSGKQLINDLDLTVAKPGGTTNFANGRTSVDATNNVEMIEFAADEVGTYTVRVVARTVPQGGSQAYALVIRGPLADTTPTAPVFGANPGPASTTTGLAVAFTVTTSSGYPTPALALQSTTASAGYSFTPGTGLLTYTPPLADGGATKSFTFIATNASGSATQTVSVVVYEGIPVAPASIWASATNATDFAAAWSSVSGATSYRLDVATNSAFSKSGGSVTLIDEDFVALTDWTDGGTASDTTHAGAASPCRGLGTGDTLDSPAVNYPTQMMFYVDASAGGNNKIQTNYYSLNGGASWTLLGTFTSTTAGATITQVLTSSPNLSGSTNVQFRFVSALNTWYLDDVKVTGGGTPSSSYLPGYSNRTVAGTSQSVTGLTVAATYYFRARAVSGGGTSPNSPTGSVTTTSSSTAPAFTSGTSFSATVGVAMAFTEIATGNPTPVLALQSTTASSGYSFTPGTGQLNYTPPQADVGTKTFMFTASNSAGTATQAVSVVVGAATPPTVSFGGDRVVGEEGGAAVSLPVNLSFAANATVNVAIAGTALNGTDFNCSTTLVFSAAGANSSNLVFSIANDALPEGPESAKLRLGPLSGATLGATTQAVFFIRDDDAFAIVSGNLSSGTNLLNDVTTYDDAGGRILEALQPDIVLLQEWVMKTGTTYRAFVDEYFGTNYSYYVEPESDSYPMPNGIISRWAITNSGQWADSNTTGRDFAWARIDLPGLRNLNAVGVHFKATDLNNPDGQDAATRLDEAQALTNYIAQAGWPASDYLVVGGDLNLTNRTEMTLRTLTNVVSDARQPADQDGDKDTNSGRDRSYDFVLPNGWLNARHTNYHCYGYTFTNGLVFDTRPANVIWANGLPPPALATDSGEVNMQHMAVLKVFAFESSLEPPAALWASATNTTSFTAAWSTVADATGYRLDVATNASFGGGETLMDEDFTDYSDWTDGGTASDTSHFGAASPCRALGSNDTLTSPAVDYPTQLTFYADASATGDGATTTNYYSLDGGASWLPVGSFTVGIDGATVVQALTSSPNLSGSTNVMFRFVSDFNTWYLDDVNVVGGGAGGPGYVAGYSNRTVSSTTQSVTGLVSGATCYFRVRAVDATSTSLYSSVANVTTLSSGTAPVFTSGTSYGATTGVAMAFTVTATGEPAPALALRSTTASSGYAFTAGTGVLDYTPPESDAGTKTFTFTASNSAGVATQTVSVGVTAGIPGAPASLWASATNSASFTATWSPVLNATSYRLDVGTNSMFSDAGGLGTTLIDEGFDNGIAAPSGWTFTAVGGTYATSGNYGLASPSLKLDATGDAIQTPVLSGPTNVSFWIKGQTTDSNSALLVESAAGGSWSTVTNLTDSLPTTGTTPSCPLGTAVTNLRFTYTKSAGNLSFDDVRVTGAGSSSPSYVAGYSNLTVAGTSQAVTGLVEGATYYFRARAVNGSGTGTYSSVASVTTLGKSDQTITFPAIGAQLTTNTVLLSATASSGLAVSYAVANGPAVLAGSAVTFTNAGSVSLVASQAGNASWNAAPDMTNTFTVTKAAAGVALTNLEQIYNGAARIAMATTLPTGLVVDVTYDGSAAAPTNAGSYAVTGTVASAMYQGMANATLTVAKASATVMLGGLAHTYDGNPKSATATTLPTGLVVEITYDGSIAAPAAVGSYAVTGAVNEINYAGFAVDTLVISAAPTPFEAWVAGQGQDPSDPDYAPDADKDVDGMTTWEEYLADTDPATNGSMLAITGRYFIASTEGGTGQIRMAFPASTGRFYQLEYCTGLTNHIIGVTNLGWGVPGMVVTSDAPATWYGVIRALLQEPY
jgi:endonuclease/exonuclease/phosphatase family metal-dependent hydrolase